MSKRKPINSNSNTSSKNPTFSTNFRNPNFNFRPNTTQEDRGGTRPIPPPSSVGQVLVTMIVHLCKKSLLYDPKLKAAIYFIAVFLIGMIVEIRPVPKSYFARSNNFFNTFFIKWAWAWLLSTAGPWVILTSYTIGCGRRSIIIKHLVRLAFATLMWMLWINVFIYIETNFGRCLNTKDRSLQTKSRCLQAGNFWSSFDISGHAFIIIYSCLILSEEAYSLLGWERINDFIMNEEYTRKSSDEIKTGLSKLSDEDLNFLKNTYKALTPYLKGLFIIMTIQQIIWQVMLVATILYYHIMIEKFMGAVAAILTWYATYNWLFRKSELGIIMPGEGVFKYNNLRENENGIKSKRHSLSKQGPTFMGMPIRLQK